MSIRDNLGENKYSDLVKSTLLNVGNPMRLKKAVLKNEINIAFVGGSVTYGYFPDDFYETRCFVKYLTDDWNIRFADKYINIRKYGVSGTDSSMGICVCEKHLHDFSPDIVFVDYAINEHTTKQGIVKFESLIRKLLSLESQPAVVPLAFVCGNGYSCEDFMLMLARHYDLAFVGFHDTLVGENSQVNWDMYSHDNGHPTPEGHRFIADCVQHCLDTASTTEIREEIVRPPMVSNALENIRLLDENDIVCQNIVLNHDDYFCFFDGVCNDILSDKGMKITAEHDCSQLIVVYAQSNSADYGTAEVLVDGEKIADLQGFSIFGWGNPVSQIVLSEQEKKHHKFEIRMAKEDKKKKFCVLEIGIDCY